MTTADNVIRAPGHLPEITAALRIGPVRPVRLWWACPTCNAWHPLAGSWTTRSLPRPGTVLARRAPRGCQRYGSPVDIAVQSRPLRRSWAYASPRTSFRINHPYVWPPGFPPAITTHLGVAA
jgi:hypothetical protein